MVNSKDKGARAESLAKELLVSFTRLNWQRVPQSGGLSKEHKLKGDLYIPNEKNIYCIEVKHYKDDHLTSKLLTSTNPQLLDWWNQTVREAQEIERQPLLLFKFDRSKWFICTECTLEDYELNNKPYFIYKYNDKDLILQKFEDWLNVIERKFIK